VRVIVLLLASAGIAFGKPDLSQPLGRTVAEEPPRYYHFIQREIASDDEQRRYRIWIAKPDKLPLSTGYPVLYVLDGNAALGAITPQDLAALDKGRPPLQVCMAMRPTYGST
jgi:hypothetical protein